MADGYALALQKALVAALKADTALTALVDGRVYDAVPDNATRPFLRIGGIEVRPLRSDCGEAATVTFSIESVSRSNRGRVEATRCSEAVVAALDGQPISVTGFTTVTMQLVVQSVGFDHDGKNYEAVAAFQTILDA